MVRPRKERSPGFTLIELLIVLGLLAFLISLLPAAAQKARDAERRTQSLNNLKEMSLAALNLASSSKQKLPPGVGDFAGSKGTVFYFLLPYLEQNAAVRKAVGAANVEEHVIPVFTAPSDRSLPASHRVQIGGRSYGAISYAANGFVFAGDYKGKAAFADYYLDNGAVNPKATAGLVRPGAEPPEPTPATKPAAIIPRTFNDGTSFTILFMERYALCALTDGDPKKPGAHAWGYAAGGYDSQHAPIQMNLRLPQWAPPVERADAALPQSLAEGPICVGMADGSTRAVTSKILPLTWAKVLLPNDGSLLPKEWHQ